MTSQSGICNLVFESPSAILNCPLCTVYFLETSEMYTVSLMTQPQMLTMSAFGLLFCTNPEF